MRTEQSHCVRSCPFQESMPLQGVSYGTLNFLYCLFIGQHLNHSPMSWKLGFSYSLATCWNRLPVELRALNLQFWIRQKSVTCHPVYKTIPRVNFSVFTLWCQLFQQGKHNRCILIYSAYTEDVWSVEQWGNNIYHYYPMCLAQLHTRHADSKSTFVAASYYAGFYFPWMPFMW